MSSPVSSKNPCRARGFFPEDKPMTHFITKQAAVKTARRGSDSHSEQKLTDTYPHHLFRGPRSTEYPPCDRHWEHGVTESRPRP